MRSLRQLAALGIILAPLSLAWPGPALAGGGAGMTLTASLDHLQDPNPRFLAGTRHTVFVTVADDPGEASLRQIRVGVADLDPADFTVTCDTGTNGSLSLEPHQSLRCTAEFPAEIGLRTILATATAQVPGLHPETRMRTLNYTGFAPPPPPPAAHAAVLLPSHHSAPLSPAGGSAADDPPARPPIMPVPPGSLPPGLPPGAVPVAGDPAVSGDPVASGDPAAADPPAGGPLHATNCPKGSSGGPAGAAGSSCCPTGAAKILGTKSADSGSASCCPGGSGVTTRGGSASEAAGSTCCPGTSGAATVTGRSAAGTSCCPGSACPVSHSLRTAGQSPFGLALTGTSAPYLGAAALAVMLGGAGLVRLGRIRAARR